MALEIVDISAKGTLLEKEVVEAAQAQFAEGVLYLNFPLRKLSVKVDALLVSPNCGLVPIIFTDDLPVLTANIDAIEDQLFAELEALLKTEPKLRTKRELVIKLDLFRLGAAYEGFRSANELFANVTKQEVSQTVYTAARATVEGFLSLPDLAGDRSVDADGGYAAIFAAIDGQIKDLDPDQRSATLRNFSQAERIRGLAGSGKTVILAYRAAFLHILRPDLKIAFVFYTRSLYQQVRALILRFCNSKNVEPNWENLQVLHAWGSSWSPGLYYEICSHYSVKPHTFASAYNYQDPFREVCSQLLAVANSRATEPAMYDYIFIDEAQDLPVPFFELAFKAAKDSKQIVWAYDELQNLNRASLPPPEELFGSSDGVPNLPLELVRDLVLKTCYRTPPWIITMAHAIGFGFYRKCQSDLKVVQFIKDEQLWKAIGYEVVEGEFTAGSQVSLRRAPDSTPSYFNELLTVDTSFSTHCFQSRYEELQWICKECQRLIGYEGVRPEQIMLIFLDPREQKKWYPELRKVFLGMDIECHLVGFDSSTDTVFQRGSVTVTGTLRAKGNEAFVVFVIGGDYALSRSDSVQGRNYAFTAMTRAKALLYLTGAGDRMRELQAELAAVREHEFKLTTKVPTDEEMERIKATFAREVGNTFRESVAIKSLRTAAKKARNLGIGDEEIRNALFEEGQ